MAVALAAHWGLLLFFLTAEGSTIRPPTDTLGMDFGAQGISLSLVAGRAGGPFADSQTDRGQDSDRASGPETAPAEDTQVPGHEAPISASDDLGHRTGGSGGASQVSAMAANGSGYNPAVLASLAPLSFSKESEPGLLPQVLPCLRTPIQREVALNVVLSDGGVFVDAYPPDDQSIDGQRSEDGAGAVAVVEALKACSPYRDVPIGLDRRLTLVVPQSGAGPAQ